MRRAQISASPWLVLVLFGVFIVLVGLCSVLAFAGDVVFVFVELFPGGLGLFQCGFLFFLVHCVGSFVRLVIGRYCSWMVMVAASMLNVNSSASGSTSGSPPPSIPICVMGVGRMVLIGRSSNIVRMSCAVLWLKSALAEDMFQEIGFSVFELIARYRKRFMVFMAWSGAMSSQLLSR